MQLRLPLRDGLPHDDAPTDLPSRRRVYVNRSLRFDLVGMVGFDMDYTLAIYRQDEMDRLSVEATANKLVELGYPERVRAMPYRTDFPIRGLLIDRKLGNVLKMDRYRYVKKAYHGMRELSREERQQLYQRRPIKVATARYHFVDTLYALSEVAVFAAAIDALEAGNGAIDYGALFDDIRRSIDLAHRDGTILSRITAEPERFLVRDPDLAPTLHKLRSAGKKLFLLTNSHAEYTDRVMSYLFDEVREYPSWKAFFDIIVTAACKPSFFTETQVEFEPAEPGLGPPNGSFERGRMYRGGCMAKFREHADVEGDQVLYVGDHIYGDVLRAKKETAWRTAMIVQEMDHEMRVHAEMAGRFERTDELEAVSDLLYEELRVRQREARDIGRRLDEARNNGGGPTTELETRRLQHRRAIDRLKTRLRDIQRELNELEDHIERAFHPFWGSLFKAGPEVSMFGDQVEQYACLYTDRVSNLLHYSPLHFFRSPRDRMPHELY
ncbi:MAG: HAD-IG family 5'-nucleotidase [Sandaracinaceae bacterium]|nr:HAD-IG family 5'-nucleotidase [Sandaracinaceae bacterium]